MSFERYKADLDKLITLGNTVYWAYVVENIEDGQKKLGLTDEDVKGLPLFGSAYQSWYSEALACISQLLPDRIEDFVSYYKPAKVRKEISQANYTISDALQGLQMTRRGEKLVTPAAALPSFIQQLKILEGVKKRFESSLFDVRTLVQADMFDNELDAADELNKNGWQRAAGAISGVVLEGHLQSVCVQHKIVVPKNPSIGELNDLLKKHTVADVPTWGFIQHLGDLRNLCDHKKSTDPTKEQISELVAGVRKITKTLY